TKGPVARQGLLFYLQSVGERSPEEDKSAGSGFARCAATARRVAGRTPAINCQASNSEEAHPDGWAFLRLWPGMHCRMAAPPYPATGIIPPTKLALL
ncbi:TPA: hypothetical protein ACJK1G_003914, partial [Salmonella enterica subsp. diarizonae serovar 61:k:1,5,7]